MATRQSYFYNSNGGDRKYNADSMIDWLTPFFTTGVFNNHFRVVGTGEMKVTIEGGYCNVQGRVMHQWDSDILDVPVASGNLSRIDIAVIRRNDTAREIYPMIVSGGFSENPTRPALVRENGIYDLQLAEWLVKPGVIAINQVDITDTRMNPDLCGWVVGTVPQVDFSQIYAQFTEFFTSYKSQIAGEYANYKNELDSRYAEFQAWAQQYESDGNTAAAAFAQWITDFKQQSEEQYNLWYTTITGASADRFNQWYDENTADFTQQFTDWFQSIQDVLDGDVTTNLANSILALQDRATAIEGVNTGQNERLTSLEDYINDNLSFSREAWLGNAYAGTAYLSSGTA